LAAMAGSERLNRWFECFLC